MGNAHPTLFCAHCVSMVKGLRCAVRTLFMYRGMGGEFEGRAGDSRPPALPSSQSSVPRLRAVQGLDLFLGEAEAALALLVGFQGLAELVFPEVGPQGLGDVEFGVG